jgi:hypothetical protein
LGWEIVSAEQNESRVSFITYQIADHDLALTNKAGTLSGRGLSSVASRLNSLLDASSGSSGGGRPASGAASCATASGLALGREDLVERLVKLAGRHN